MYIWQYRDRVTACRSTSCFVWSFDVVLMVLKLLIYQLLLLRIHWFLVIRDPLITFQNLRRHVLLTNRASSCTWQETGFWYRRVAGDFASSSDMIWLRLQHVSYLSWGPRPHIFAALQRHMLLAVGAYHGEVWRGYDSLGIACGVRLY